MTVQALFFDIDGTLLDFQSHRMSQSTIQAIQEVQKKGIKVFLCTSRPKSTIDLIEQIHEIQWDGAVAANGMQVWDEKWNLIQDASLSDSTLSTIFSWASHQDIPIYSAGEKVYFTDHKPIVDEFVDHFHLPTPVFQKYEGEKQLLITLISRDKANYHELQALEPDIRLLDVGDFNVDIFPKGISKLTGIRFVMDYLGFEPHNYMSFGDTDADKEMIEDAKIGVAMHNGMNSVKEMANYICPTDSVDSIAQCLSYYQLID